MERFASEGSLIPEQIWDSDDMPERELTCGRPSGSAMPLVWAHAEYIKLRRSLHDGRVFDQPPQPVQRYIKDHTGSPHVHWRFNHKNKAISAGKILRIETLDPATVHWSSDGWQTSQDSETHDTGLGTYIVDLPTDKMKKGTTVSLTFYWPKEDRWEGTNYEVQIGDSS
jgi:glucoamylase